MSTVGTSVRRIDGAAKVRGEAVYGMDYTEAGALTAKILRAPVAAARILRLDTSAAEAMPGVRAIATAKDAPGLSGGFGVLYDQTLFADDVIRYVGEPIAAVAADTEEQALAAINAIHLELENLEPVIDVHTALAPDTRLIHPDWKSYHTMMPSSRGGNLAWSSEIVRGDVDAAFAQAHLVVEDEFRSQRQHQTSIEPHAAVARFEDGRYVVTTPTQFPFNVRTRIAEFLGVKVTEIRVIVPTIGGGFGGKIDVLLEPFVCILAKKAGRPVRIVNTRHEEQTTAGPREDGYVRLRTAVDENGKILAQEGLIIANNGANSSGETVGCSNVPPLVFGATYAIPNARFVSQVVYTNTPPPAAFRGVNGPYCVRAQEVHLDRIARKLGIDRREFRKRNLFQAGGQMFNDQRLDDAYLEEAMAAIEELWPWHEAQTTKGPLRGIAVVPLTWITNPGPAAASIKLEEDGSIIVTCAAAEIGSGAVATGVRQIVADELGVAFEQVKVTAPDTDAAGYDGGAGGSRTTYGMGNAALDASAKVRQQILDAAAHMLEAASADLVIDDGQVQVAGAPGTHVSLAEVAVTAMYSQGPIAATGQFAAPPIAFDGGCMVGALFASATATTYHAHMAEVEVDPDTGKVTVLRYAVVQDVGRIINPQMIEGQIQGG